MLLNLEEKLFLKIYLLLTLSSKAVRHVFDGLIPPDLLKATLTRNFVILRKLKNKGIISNVQWNILFPNQEGSPCSSSFDTTLMIILLRHLAKIEVSDKLPVYIDRRSAYLGTIKYYRNLLGHSVTNTLTSEIYGSAWGHLCKAIRELTTSNSFDEKIRRLEEKRIEEEIRRVEEMDIDPVNSDTESEIKNSFLEINRLRAAYMMLEEDLKKMKSILSDPVPFNIRSQFSIQLRSWQEDDQMYVKTSWSEKILNLVQQSKLAAIIGGPGCGKTALLHNVAFQMAAIGYDVIPITFPCDIIEFYDAKRNTLFVIDNFCGKYSLDLQIHDSWIQVVKHITDIPLMDNFKIVLACRLQVFWDVRFNFKSMFENCSLNLHENTLTWAEKKQIAQKYNLTIEDKDIHTKINLLSCPCFPLLCTLNKHHPENDTEDMFMYPYHVLENELEIMFLNCEDGKFCAIVLLVIFNNELPQTCLSNSVTNENKDILENTLEACNFKKYHKIKDDIHSLEHSFVIKTNGVYHALNSKMFDFLAHFVGDKMMPFLIQNAVPELINTRFMFVNPTTDIDSFEIPIDDESCYMIKDETWDKLGKYVIIIPTELELDYFQRMISDWSRGYAYLVLSNGNFFYRPFFTYLNQLNSKQLFNLVNKEDVVDKSTPIISYVRSSLNMFPHIGWLVSIGADINYCNKYNMTALYYACFLGQLDVVEELLKKHADLNKCDKDGWSPLHIACANGFENIVNRLIDCNANINLRNNVGNSPLHNACNNKHIATVKILLERNADRNLSNNEGVSPIELAQRSEDNILFLLLQDNENMLKSCMKDFSKKDQIRNYVDVNYFDTLGRSPLFLASKRGNTDIVKSLLQEDAEVNTCNNTGVSPLMIASSSGFLTIVQDLLDNGAECDQTDIRGQSPLIFAVKNKHLDIMFELLINNANANIRDEAGNTPLIYACSYCDIFAIKKLLLFKSNINECNDDGISPLFMACDKGNINIFRFLANSGASIPMCLLIAVQKGRLDIIRRLPKNKAIVNYTDEMLETPLLIACRQGRLDIATELMQYNAHLNHRNQKGVTPLLEACAYHHNGLVYQLLRKGAKVNFQNFKRQTPLHLSCERQYHEITLRLLEFNAQVNRMDIYGETPLCIACRKGDVKTVKLLINQNAKIEKCRNIKHCPIAEAMRNKHYTVVLELLCFYVNSYTKRSSRGTILATTLKTIFENTISTVLYTIFRCYPYSLVVLIFVLFLSFLYCL